MNIGDIFLSLLADGSRLAADIERQGMAAANKAGGAIGATLGGSMATGLTKSGKAMESLGSSMTRNLTLPIVGAGAAIVATGVKFDTTLRQIVALTDVTANEIGGIREQILALAPAVGKSPEELAQGFYFLASAGFNTAEAMTVLQSTAKASAAGLGDTADISRVVGAAINAFGKDNLSATDAVDQLIRAVKDGTAEAPAFAGALGDVLGSAGQLGATFADTTAAIAAMTLKGISADEAATSLNQVFVSLVKTTPAAEEGLNAVGLSSEELRKQLREKGLLSVLQTLSERFEGNDTAAAAAFGNVRALRGILALTTGDAAQTAKVFNDVANGTTTLADAFAETEGPGRKIDQAMADIQVTLIDLSEDVLPVFVDVLKQGAGILKGITGVFKSLPDPVRAGVVQVLALTAALGPLLFIGGKVTKTLGALVGVVGKVGGKIGSAIGSRMMAGIAEEVTSEAAGKVVGDALADGATQATGRAGFVAALKGLGLAAAGAIGLGLAAGIAVLAVGKMIADQIDAQKTELQGSVTRALTEGSLQQLQVARDAIQKQLDSQKIFGVIDFQWMGERSGENGLDAQLARLQAEIDRRVGSVPKSVGDFLAAGQAAVTTGAKTMVDGVVPAVEGAGKDAGTAASTIPDSVAAGVLSDQAVVTDAMSTLRNLMKNELTPTQRIARNVGILASKELARALHDKRPAVRQEAQRTRALAIADLTKMIAGGGKVGREAMEELRRKMHDKNPAVRRAAKKAYSIVTGELNKIPPKAGDAGTRAGTAFKAGFQRALRGGAGPVTLVVRAVASSTVRGANARGGPAAAGVPFLMNEQTQRSEVYVPQTSGYVLTRAQAESSVRDAAGGGGGDLTVNVPIAVSGALPVRTITDLSREMQRVGAMGILPPNRLSPTYKRGEAARA